VIRIFYGNDRVKARDAAERILGADYEVIEAENLTRADMDSLFLGTSLFGTERRILVKGLAENKECWEKLGDYLETTHSVVLLEASFDKRTALNKELAKSKAVELKEFKLPEIVDKYAAFKPFDMAWAGNSKMALKKCDELMATSDPYALIGAMGSQAVKLLDGKNANAVAAVKILADIDIATKSAEVDPWDLVKIALVKIATLRKGGK